MTFTRTTDYALVARILRSPWCYRRMVNDDAPPRHLLEVKATEGIECVVAEHDRALFLLKHVPGGIEVHFCFRPSLWGRTETVAREFVRWIREEYPATRIIGPVPGYNRLALRLAKRAGFREIQRIPQRVSKHGVLYDLHILELEAAA